MKNYSKQKPILIAAAVDTELEYLLEKLKNKLEKDLNGYNFWEGNINSYPVVIYKTEVGTINATISTVLAIKEYNPLFIVNTGTAGAHRKDIMPKDIIIGKEIISIDSYKTGNKAEGEGSNSLEWKQPGFRFEKVVNCDDELLKFVTNHEFYDDAKVYIGRIGSGNVFNKEIDKINKLHESLNTICEEMEGIGVYKTCDKFEIPKISFRVISNNEIVGLSYDPLYGLYSQKFTYEFVRKYIERI